MLMRSLLMLALVCSVASAQETPKDAKPVLDDPRPALTRDEIVQKDIDGAIKKLESDNYVDSEEAYAELIQIGRKAVPSLIKSLDHDKPAVRRAACDLLGQLRDSSAVTGLVRALADLEEYGVSISSASARALGLIGDPQAVPDLIKLLDSPRAKTDVELRYEIVRALGLLRSRDAVEPLKKLIIDMERTPYSQLIIGCSAIESLGLLRAKDAVRDIAKQLEDKTVEQGTGRSMEFYAARALERITGFSYGPLFGPNDEKTKETLKKWNDWWKEEKKQADLVENKPRIEATRVAVRQLEGALEQFKLAEGKYPEKLDDLVTKPVTAQKWPEGGYLKSVPKDAWDRPFVYRPLGTAGFPFDLLSYGLDGKEGGTAADEDLWDHDRKPKPEELPKKDGETPKDGKK